MTMILVSGITPTKTFFVILLKNLPFTARGVSGAIAIAMSGIPVTTPTRREHLSTTTTATGCEGCLLGFRLDFVERVEVRKENILVIVVGYGFTQRDELVTNFGGLVDILFHGQGGGSLEFGFDHFVDLDSILSNSYTIEVEEPQWLVLGDTHLEIKKPKVVSRITTHGQWINAFRILEDAVNFAFKGCYRELRCKNFVGQRRDILTEIHEFRHVQDAHLLEGGIAVPTSSPGAGGSRPATSFESAAHPHIRWFTEMEDTDDTPDVSSFLPKYMRGMAWKKNQSTSYSRTAHYTEIDEPLPHPPAYEFQNAAVMRTIRESPDLFHNPRVIEVDRFESLLKRHPNASFVQSVLAGLRDGFWPWMNTHHDEGYPETWDNSWAPPAPDRERDFINSQRDVEIEKGRFSRTFGPPVT
ncbi:hypothetical protein B0H11DRAFT_2219842 [Mycena galericulata]|nr:hypothetical protein B0H11DRAFT_2219842 [Mycena galericulata]